MPTWFAHLATYNDHFIFGTGGTLLFLGMALLFTILLAILLLRSRHFTPEYEEKPPPPRPTSNSKTGESE